jgi:hypothetical protein
MKGKKVFTNPIAQEIIDLINKKVTASSDKQRGIRTKIRRLGFYASDFGLSGGYTSKDFKRFVTIIGGSVSNVSSAKKTISSSQHEAKLTTTKKDSDENYVLGISDDLLKIKSSRQHQFEFLLGDAGTRLPVDAYYEILNLVIEFRERQHTEAVKHFDKPDVMTVSGVSRGEQRKIYDQRRRDVLPKNGIKLIEISYSDFEYDSRKRIVRNKQNDFVVIKKLLLKYGK